MALRCHYAGECSHVCPKGVDPAKAIQYLKRQLLLDYPAPGSAEEAVRRSCTGGPRQAARQHHTRAGETV